VVACVVSQKLLFTLLPNGSGPKASTLTMSVDPSAR
jgi:hypothetical protein